MSNIVIRPEHQSSPKETNAEKAIKLAAQEMHEGKFRPERPLEEDAFGKLHDDFWVQSTDAISSHPRVQDAMRELAAQVADRSSNEWVEKAEMLHTMNAMARAGHRWDGQQRWQGEENENMRMVNLMTPTDFIKKLQKAGISAAVEPKVSIEKKANKATGVIETVQVELSDAKICLGKAVTRGVVGLFAWVDGVYTRVDKLQVPLGPEWTLMRFDEFDIPTNERFHGWRSAVLGLIRQGVITEQDADRAFGPVKLNAASLFYRQQLHEYRNERIGKGNANTTTRETAAEPDADFAASLSATLGFEVADTQQVPGL